MKTKQILTIVLTLALLVTSVVAPMSTASAATTTYTLTVTINTGVQSVMVIAGSTTKTFTSSGTMTISSGTYVQYTVVAKSDYYISSGGSSNFYMTSAKTIAPTATHNPYTLTVTINEGVQSVTVAYGSTTKTFTSSGTMSVPFATSFTWTATAKTGYVLSAASGSNTMYYPITIAPTATLTNYTLTVTVGTGVQSITVSAGSTSQTFTSSGTMSIPAGTGVTWTAVATTGYNLTSSSGAFNMSAAKTIAPTTTIKTNVLTVTLSEGVQSVTVAYGSTSKTFTSNGVLSIPYGTTVTWTAKAKAGYNIITASGTITSMTSAQTIAPTATKKSVTVTMSYYPTNANYTTFSWTLEWVSGKSLTGAVSDYVTMTVASDGKSVTLTFVKDFSAGEMVLTCYATADPTIQATCTVKCGS